MVLLRYVRKFLLFLFLSTPGVDAPESATFGEEASAIGVAFHYSWAATPPETAVLGWLFCRGRRKQTEPESYLQPIF